MIERDGYPPGVPCWIDTSQPDPEAAVRFYQGLFGWEFTDRMPPGSEGSYYVARLHGKQVAAVGSQPEGSPPNPNWAPISGWTTPRRPRPRRRRPEGRVSSSRLTSSTRGVWRCCPIRPVPYSACGRRAPTAAPNCQRSEHLELERPQHPRPASRQGLLRGGVRLGGGGGRSGRPGQGHHGRDPGYGDFLEQLEPEIRRRQTEAGVPPGFADAIGWMSKMSPDQFPEDVPSHWSVTFAVDDTNAVVAAAERLGAACWSRHSMPAPPGSRFSPTLRERSST